MLQILIVDDERPMRDVMVAILKQDLGEPCIFFEAGDGLEGLKMAREHHPDLIICDVNMPEMNGYDVLTTLRSEEATANISFIFVTAMSERADIRYGFALGGDDYLPKPFTPQELVEAVHAWQRKKSTQEASLKKIMGELQKNITTALPHEFRTAVMVIEGFVQLMLEDETGDIPPQQSEMLKMMQLYIQRLHTLAEKFWWYSRTELADTELSEQGAETVYPKKIIEATAKAQAESAQRIGDLVLNVEPVQLTLTKETLTKIVEEVIENAFKFSPVGTPVEIYAHHHSNHYRITVVDHGHGMTRQQIALIGAFMQFDRSHFEQQGTGLGLTIAKRLVEMNRGRLEIESSPEHNTTIVTVFLPITPPPGTPVELGLMEENHH